MRHDHLSKIRPDRPLPVWQRAGLAFVSCALTSLLATPLLGHLDEANIVMLFLLTVLILAVSLGRTAGVVAAFCSVGFFDFFFVAPRFSMTVADGQYLITFAVMLATALITAHLAAGLRRQAEIAARREMQTHALYEMARDLGGALSLEQVEEITRRALLTSFGAEALLLLPDPGGALLPLSPDPAAPRPATEGPLARMAFDGGQPVDGTDLTGRPIIYLPLKAPMRVRGVLAVTTSDAPAGQLREWQALFGTMASLVAIAVERLHYVEVAQSTQIEVVSERLRSSILSALSHDLRTPLTALVGLADSLTLLKPPLPEVALDTAQAMHEQAARLAGMVGNLLDMARLHAGQVQLRREWQPVEEVIGAAIKLLGGSLAEHPVRVALPADLPLLEFDAVLIERVLGNLLENAAKYSPPGSPIDIVGRRLERAVEIRVDDHGQGFPAGQTEHLFDIFVRGEGASLKPGTGLGLAICRAIVDAHGGEIRGENRPAGGGSVAFTLPTGQPPRIEEETP